MANNQQTSTNSTQPSTPTDQGKPVNLFSSDEQSNSQSNSQSSAVPPIETPGGKSSDKPSAPPKPTSQPTPPVQTTVSAPQQPVTQTKPSTPPPSASKSTPPPPETLSSLPKSPGSGSPPPIPVKSSPFRFLIPILAILIIGGLVYFILSRFLPGILNQDGSSDPQTRQTIELTYWGLWEPEHIMNDVLKDFQLTHPHINVNYQQQSITDYRERLQNALQSGQGPDLFRFHQTWTPMIGQSLATMPNSVMSQEEYAQTFYPSAVEWLSTPNGVVGIPLMFDGLGLYFNRDIFDAAGATPPSTWEELRRTANQLTVKTSSGVIQRAGIALGTTGNVDHWSDILGLMMLQNSANPALPNNQAGQGALTFYTIFSQRDGIWNDTLPNSTYAFAIERTAMIIAPSWRAHEILESNREIKFAIAPVPQLPDTNVTWASFWAEGVSSQSSRDKQQAAWELLNYLSSKETMRQFYTRASQERLFGEPFSRVDLADQLINDPYVGAYISTAPQAKSWFLSDRTFDNGINDRIIKYYEDAVNATNQGVAASQALETAEQGINQVLQQYGGTR